MARHGRTREAGSERRSEDVGCRSLSQRHESTCPRDSGFPKALGGGRTEQVNRARPQMKPKLSRHFWRSAPAEFARSTDTAGAFLTASRVMPSAWQVF